jgi:hypothetical protein
MDAVQERLVQQRLTSDSADTVDAQPLMPRHARSQRKFGGATSRSSMAFHFISKSQPSPPTTTSIIVGRHVVPLRGTCIMQNWGFTALSEHDWIVGVMRVVARRLTDFSEPTSRSIAGRNEARAPYLAACGAVLLAHMGRRFLH